MNLNKIFIVGNLTRDPEVRALPSGQNVVNFAVATNRIWNKDGQKQQDTQYHNVVVFGRMADTCAKYLFKGKMVLVEGRIQNRSWDAPDGTKKYRTEIVAEGIQLGPRTGQETGAALSSSSTSRSAPSVAKTATPKEDKEEIPIIEQDSEEVNVSDIPF
ncbi:MAG: single-stranded DNA-binding protein [Parcubacteria group bacterium]|nr:single-stranded DNA-binding protein [Parcubacteria group bacterium]